MPHFLQESKKKKKKPSAQSQVGNKINSGLMNAICYGGLEESKPDFYIGAEKGNHDYCHVTSGSAAPLNESFKLPNDEYKRFFKSIGNYMNNHGLTVKPFPSVELNHKSQDGLFIYTGYYAPNEKKVVLFVDGRHPKDILRSFAHEMVHHAQNLRGENLSFTNEDNVKDNESLERLEAEAYLKGNLYFRKWTEYFKNGEQEALNESKLTKKQIIKENIFPNLHFGININIDDTNWLELIFSGQKTIETRDGSTYSQWAKHKGEQVGLVKTTNHPSLSNPTGMLVGYATITDVIKYTPQNFNSDYNRHKVPYTTEFGKNCRCGLLLTDIHKISTPLKLVGKGQQAVRPIEYANINESKKKVVNDEGELVPDVCPRCGSKIGIFLQGEPVFKCTNKKCNAFFGTLPFPDSLKESIDEYLSPDEVDLSSFKPKSELNPKFWVDDHLDSRIRMRLLDIAEDFIRFMGVDWAEPVDIILTGSLAGLNYDDKYSDIDVHIIFDYSDIDENKELVDNYFYSQKKLWNDEHKDLSIYGFPVELFVEDSKTDSKGNVYSLMKDRWIDEPDTSKGDNTINPMIKQAVRLKVSAYTKQIDKLDSEFDKGKDNEYILRKLSGKVDALLRKIKQDRQSGLEDSEYSVGNITFKSLRRNGYLAQLVELKKKIYDKSHSLP